MADISGIGEPIHGSDVRRVPWRRQVKAFTLRTVRRLFRNRSALIWGIGSPVFFYLTSVLTTGGSVAARGATAVTFGVFGAFSMSMVIFASSLRTDIGGRRYRKLRALSVAPSADAVGRFLGGFLLSVVSFLVVIGLGVATGGRLAVRSVVSVPVVAVALLLFCSVGMGAAVLVAAAVDDGRYIVGLTNLVVLGLFFLTGYNGVAPGAAPGPLTAFVNFAPNALAARLLIYHLAPDATGTLSPPAVPSGPAWLGLLAGYAVVVLGVASVVMRRAVYDGEAGE